MDRYVPIDFLVRSTPSVLDGNMPYLIEKTKINSLHLRRIQRKLSVV